MTFRTALLAGVALAAFSISAPPLYADEATSTPDTTPPVITAPADQSFSASTFPTSPTLVPATATDDTDPSPTISYDPLSFPLGTTTVLWTATDTTGNFSTTTSLVIISEEATPTPAQPALSVTITIRDGVHSFTGTTTLADASDPAIDISPTGSTSTVSVPADSLLATLLTLDAATSDFDITQLSYYSSYGSFIIDCVRFSGASADCYNWTFAVNGAYPQIGANAITLTNGDIVHLFFGSPRSTSVSISSVESGTPFTATALSYDLDSGAYVPAPGLTLGVGTANPDFTFTELATSTSDNSGEAIFTLSATGTYSVGIQEDYYFPAATITITNASSSTATSTPSTPTSPPSGGGGGTTHPTLNMQNALAFLASQQEPNGSFGNPIFTDWVAIAYGAVDGGPAEAALRAYMKTAAPAMSNITDYERHAMALEALGINPYTGAPHDYITPITASFNGTQFGDPVVHDDIFAFFALLHAGYTPTDPMLHKAADYIISKQVGGYWGDPDTTAAAIMALSTLFGPTGYSQSKLGASVGQAAGMLAYYQNQNGSWGPAPQGSVDSTSWVQTMINSVKEFDPAHANDYLSGGGFLPTDFIAYAQKSDGGIDSPTRVWSTSYAVMAASGKNWLTSLSTFPASSASQNGSFSGGSNPYNGSGIVLGTSTSTATSTVNAFTASTTLNVATTSITGSFGVGTTSPATTALTISPPAPAPTITEVIPQKTFVAATKPDAAEDEEGSPTQTTGPAPKKPKGFLSRVWGAVVSFFDRFF